MVALLLIINYKVDMKTKKEHNRINQQLLRDKRKKDGWKFVWIPPHLIQKVKSLIKGGEK